MDRIKASAYSLLLAICLLASPLVSSVSASATSDYDSLLQVAPALEVYTDGSSKTQTMDISETWWHDFKQTYAKRVAQNIGWPTNFVAEFEDIVSHGGSWGVFTTDTQDGRAVSVVGTHDPNAYCHFVGTAASGAYECTSNVGYGYVRADYFTHYSYGGNGCMGSWDNRCSDNGMNVYQAPVIESGTSGYTLLSLANTGLSSHQFFAMDFNRTYPDGYDGDRIPSGVRPVPLLTSYSGTVDCTNDPLEYMLITQDGVTNSVLLSDYESIYRAHWSHELTDSPYVITVGCGNKVAASHEDENVTPMSPTSNDWICDSTSNPAYCILS